MVSFLDFRACLPAGRFPLRQRAYVISYFTLSTKYSQLTFIIRHGAYKKNRVIPAEAGTQSTWIPVFTGMTISVKTYKHLNDFRSILLDITTHDIMHA